MNVLHDCPNRGFFTALIAAPLHWPEVLTGTAGQIARRIGQNEAAAQYLMFGFGENMDITAQPAAHDRPHKALSDFVPAPAGVDPQFILHPALGDDPAGLIAEVEIDGVACSMSVTAEAMSAVHRVFRVEAYGEGGVHVKTWVSFASQSSVVDCSTIVARKDGQPWRGHVTIRCSEPVVPVWRGGTASMLSDSKTISIQAVVDTASFSGVHRWRIAARSVWDSDMIDAGGPLAELTADEHASAARGPFYGIASHQEWSASADIEWSFAGLPICANIASAMPTIDAAWNDPARVSAPFVPRSNPNAGGTDDAFGPVCSIPFVVYDEHSITRELLWSADAWLRHPIVYSDPRRLAFVPLGPDLGPKFTTHKLQPWQGKIGDATVPIGRSAIGGKDPFDPQHRAFLLPLTMALLTGDHALRHWFEFVAASELYDRDTVVGNSGNGRQVGRILYNCVPMRMLGVESERLGGYIDEVMHQSGIEVMKLSETGSKIRPCFTSDRGVPWEAWTPWEEAQRAVGLYVAGMHGQAAEAAYTVAMVLGRDEHGWWLPYRVRMTQTPDLSSRYSPDVYSPLAAPNGLFAWCVGALRILCKIAADSNLKIDDVVHRAAQCVQDVDGAMRDHLVDEQMALHHTMTEEVEAVASTVVTA